MVRWASGVLVVALLVSSASLAGVGGSEESVAQRDDDSALAGGIAQDFDSVTVDITVHTNGSARWVFRFSKPLNESTQPDFETFAEEFNTTNGELYRGFQQRGEQLESDGQANTGREMNVTGYSKRAYVDDSGFSLGTRGVVEMSFLWTEMAATDGQRVEIGDVFDDGFYLGQRFSLVVRPGPGLAFVRALPQPDSMADADSLQDSQSITWQGEREFNPQRPLVELAPPEAIQTTAVETTTPETTAPTTTVRQTTVVPTTTASVAPPDQPGSTATATPASTATTVSPVTTNATGSPAEQGDGGTMLIIGVVLLLLGIGSVAVWRVTSTTPDDSGPTAAAESERSPEHGTPSAEMPAPESQPEGDEVESAGVVGEELLSDTDRVKQLLESNEGRMRQSEIVEETEWSKSKVSMLLSDMEDDDEITKLRVGRENLISLPGHEPEAAGSPFEDEE